MGLLDPCSTPDLGFKVSVSSHSRYLHVFTFQIYQIFPVSSIQMSIILLAFIFAIYICPFKTSQTVRNHHFWCLKHVKTLNWYWLVVYLPLWKMMEFGSWAGDIPIYEMENKTCLEPPTRIGKWLIIYPWSMPSGATRRGGGVIRNLPRGLRSTSCWEMGGNSINIANIGIFANINTT